MQRFNGTWEEYGKLEALSQSDLKMILKSPIHFSKRKEMRKETEAMAFGTAVHTAVLEPAKFKSQYLVMPSEIEGIPVNRRLKAHREWIENFKLENADKICLKEEDMDTLTGVLVSLANHETASLLLAGGESEVSGTWEHRGHACKGTIDKWHQNHHLFGNTLVELKTAKDASPETFTRDTFNRLYDFQLAYYALAVKPERVFTVVVETVYPYPIAIYDMAPWIGVGRMRVEKAFDKFEECTLNNSWTDGYTSSILPLQPASWVTAMLAEDVT